MKKTKKKQDVRAELLYQMMRVTHALRVAPRLGTGVVPYSMVKWATLLSTDLKKALVRVTK